MKLLSISDPHFNDFRAHSTLVDGVNSRLMHVDEAVREMVESGFEQECKALLVPGDIFHVRGRIKPSVYAVAYNAIAFAAEHFPVILLAGNHDMEDFKGGPTAIDFFASIPNVTVAIKPDVYRLRMPSGNKPLDVLAIPYIHKIDEFKEVAKIMAKSDHIDVVMIHQGVDDMAPSGMPAFGLTVANLQEIFGVEVPVLCGHYHMPGSKGNIIQVGSPLQHNFGDAGQDRGCWVIDLNNDEQRFVHNGFSPQFKTTLAGGDKERIEVGDFLRITASNIKDAEKEAKRYTEAGSITVQLEKEYATVHEKTVAIGTPLEMLGEYMDLFPELKNKKQELLGLYEEVCK